MFVFSITNSNISSTNGMSLGRGCICLPTNGRRGESLNKIFHECSPVMLFDLSHFCLIVIFQSVNINDLEQALSDSDLVCLNKS